MPGFVYIGSLLLCLLALGLGDGRQAHAGEWRLRPSLGVTQRYSDNVNAAPSGLEQGEFITSVNSGVSLNGQGGRASVRANYNAQRYYFLGGERENRVTHFLSSGLQTEVIRNFLFVDANATMAPTLINNTGRITNQNYLGIDQNRADVINYGFTPRLQHRFGSWATATASTSFRDTTATREDDDDDPNLAGSGNNSNYNASLASGRRFTRFDWRLNFSERSFTADRTGEESTLRNTRFQLGYRLNRKLRLNSSVGVESNDFAGNQRNGNGSGTWSIGANYNPTPRTNLAGNYGRRPFGETKNFDFSHRFRRAVINGSYQEDYRTTSEILQEQQIYRTVDEFGQPLEDLLDPTELVDPELPIDNLSLTDDVFVSRNFRVSIGYRYRLNSYSLGIFRSEQESSRTLNTEEALGTNFRWSRPLSPRSTASLSITHQDRSGSVRTGSVQALFISPRLTYRLGQHLNMSFGYSHSRNSSDTGEFDYQENSATATLSYAF